MTTTTKKKTKKAATSLNLDEMETLIIGMDSGKMNMKAKCGEKEIFYMNRYSNGFTDEGLKGKNTFNVEYKGKKITAGNNGIHSDTNEGKASQIHLMLTLTAITRFLNPNKKQKIVLIYGESVDKYYDDNQKQLIMDTFIGEHYITVDGAIFNFEIEILHLLPEGIGHILSDLPNNMGIQYAVDIGGATMNFLTIKNGKPVDEKSASYLLGMNNIVAKVSRELKRNDFGDVDDDLILQYIRKGCINPEVEEIIEGVCENQFALLDEQLGKEGISIHSILKNAVVKFIGGTSEDLKTIINKHYKCSFVKNLVVDEALMTNVRGFYLYGLAKYGNR